MARVPLFMTSSERAVQAAMNNASDAQSCIGSLLDVDESHS